MPLSFVGVGSDFFGNSIFIKPNNIALVEAEFSMSPWIKNIPFFCSLLGAISSFYLYHWSPITLVQITDTKLGRKIYSFLNAKYYFDIIYNNYFISKGLIYGYTISKLFDRGIIEMVGPYGLSVSVNKTANNISTLDSGVITTYALYIVLSLISFLFIIFSSVLIGESILDPRLLIVLFIYLIELP